MRVIVSGEVLGLGTMIDETITAKSDQTMAQIVEDRLAAHGYSTIHDGVADADSYFLRHVMKTGITDGWSISAEERSLLEMLGYDIAEGPKNPNSLGERDFTAGYRGIAYPERKITGCGGIFQLRDSLEYFIADTRIVRYLLCPDRTFKAYHKVIDLIIHCTGKGLLRVAPFSGSYFQLVISQWQPGCV